MTGDVVLLVIQSKVEDAIVCPPNENVPSVHVPVLKLQCLHVTIIIINVLLLQRYTHIEAKGVLVVCTTPRSQLAQI